MKRLAILATLTVVLMATVGCGGGNRFRLWNRTVGDPCDVCDACGGGMQVDGMYGTFMPGMPGMPGMMLPGPSELITPGM